MGSTTEARPTFQEVLEELETRFLVNVPEEELCSSERLLFQIEQSYWFYEDYYADKYPHLAHLKLKDFAKHMFEKCDFLAPVKHQCEEMFNTFRTYVTSVPVNGCILVPPSKDKLLLVRNWKGTSWTFPRGKINQDETDMACAAREVLEEVGYDVTGKISEDCKIEYEGENQRVCMYVVFDVPEEYPFQTNTRKEISKIQWFALDALPKSSYGVWPFIGRLKRLLKTAGRKKSNSRSPSRPKSAGRANDRSGSAPHKRPTPQRTRQKTGVSPARGQKVATERPQSTPKQRGHFGTEYDTCRDNHNGETFGTEASTTASWSVDDMFAVNEKLTGKEFTYDGNPHDFGSQTTSPTRGLSPLKVVSGSTETQLADSVARLFTQYQTKANGLSPSTEKATQITTSDTVHKGPARFGGQKIGPKPPAAGNTQATERDSDSQPAIKETDRNLPARTNKVQRNLFGQFEFDTVAIMGCVN